MSVYVEPGCCGCGAQKVYPESEYVKLDDMDQKLVKSADVGDPESCYNLGKSLIEGDNGFPVMLNLGENYLIKAVKANHVEALIYYSQVLQNGDKIPRNEKKAQKYLQKAAKKGSSIAHVRLGQLYLDTNDNKKAIKEFNKGVKQNNSEAMVCLSQLYKDGTGVKQNFKEALNLLKRASDNGYPDGINAYANALRTGSICHKDPTLAASMYKRNADNGNTDASCIYAEMLENGEGVEKNINEAAKYFKAAADRDNAEAAYHYSHLLINGRGVERDENASIQYLQKAVQNEYPEALYEWAVKLFYGKGVRKDEPLAEEFCKKAALKGSVNAEYFYGIILNNQEQYDQSSSYFLTAANKGHKNAAMRLAFMRMFGCGGKIDFKEAYEWFKKYDIDSQAKLGFGIMYENGFYVDKNYQTALEYYRSLQGTPLEQDGIAREAYMVLVGHGFQEPDEKRAISMFEQSIQSTRIINPEFDLGNESTFGCAYYYYLTINQNTDIAITALTDLSYRRKDMYAREKLATVYLNGIGVGFNIEQAVNLYKLSAIQGNRESLYRLALMYLTGENVNEVNKELAVQYLKRSSKLGNYDAHAKYSQCLLKGEGVPSINEKKALKHARISAENGNFVGMACYGSMLYYGKGCSPNVEEAKPYIIDASNAQIPEAMDIYGLMFQKGQGVNEDLAKGAALFEKASELGSVEATFHYAQCLEKGRGVAINLQRSAYYYKMAADKGHIESMYIYGNFSENGIGVDKNDKEAANYYLQAANKGHAESMACYAILCHDGRGIKQDYKQALMWNKKAADLGNTKAMNNYADQLIKGDGCMKNKKGAIPYLQTSSSKGDPHGIYMLGLCYENGDGVEANMQTAADMYNKSAEKGDDDGMLKAAELIEDGRYLPMNISKAYEYYMILADKGNIYSCVKMGKHLEKSGQFSDAAAFYSTAAAKEDPIAMFSYGKMLLEGKGVSKDIVNGIKYIEKSSDKEYPQALTKYATIIISGAFDVQKDEKRGLKLLKKAAELGEKDALHHLATSYEYGKGTKVNLKKAAEFYEKSYQSGNQYANDDENNFNRVQREIQQS